MEIGEDTRAWLYTAIVSIMGPLSFWILAIVFVWGPIEKSIVIIGATIAYFLFLLQCNNMVSNHIRGGMGESVYKGITFIVGISMTWLAFSIIVLWMGNNSQGDFTIYYCLAYAAAFILALCIIPANHRYFSEDFGDELRGKFNKDSKDQMDKLDHVK